MHIFFAIWLILKIIHSSKERLVNLTRSELVNFPFNSEMTFYTNKSRDTSVSIETLNATQLNLRIYSDDSNKYNKSNDFLIL